MVIMEFGIEMYRKSKPKRNSIFVKINIQNHCMVGVLIVCGVIFFLIFLNPWPKDEVEYKKKDLLSRKLENEGIALLGEKRYAEALAKFNESYRAKPVNYHNNSMWVRVGECYFGLREFKKVLMHNIWTNRETEFYFKALAAIELNDIKAIKQYIWWGRNINPEMFKALSDKYIDLENNINDFIFFYLSDVNLIFQLLRSIEKEDLTENSNQTVQLLNKVKLMIQNSGYRDYSQPRTLNHETALLLISKVNLSKLLSKKYLYLNYAITYGRKNNYSSNNNLPISSIAFLSLFKNLNAITLFGQQKLENFEVLGHLPELKEVNIGGTNIHSIDFLKQEGIKIKNDGKYRIEMYSE